MYVYIYSRFVRYIQYMLRKVSRMYVRMCVLHFGREIIQGFAKRGMMFPRKFSNKKTAALVDKIG